MAKVLVRITRYCKNLKYLILKKLHTFSSVNKTRTSSVKLRGGNWNKQREADNSNRSDRMFFKKKPVEVAIYTGSKSSDKFFRS